MTRRNYVTLREKRLANAALIEAKAEDEHPSAKQEEEQTVSQVNGFRKLKLLVKALTLSCTNFSSHTVHKVIVLIKIYHFPDFIKEGHVMDVVPFVTLMHRYLSMLSPIGAEGGFSGRDLDIFS